jgi:hypothetical protein
MSVCSADPDIDICQHALRREAASIASRAVGCVRLVVIASNPLSLKTTGKIGKDAVDLTPRERSSLALSRLRLVASRLASACVGRRSSVPGIKGRSVASLRCDDVSRKSEPRNYVAGRVSKMAFWGTPTSPALVAQCCTGLGPQKRRCGVLDLSKWLLVRRFMPCRSSKLRLRQFGAYCWSVEGGSRKHERQAGGADGSGVGLCYHRARRDQGRAGCGDRGSRLNPAISIRWGAAPLLTVRCPSGVDAPACLPDPPCRAG